MSCLGVQISPVVLEQRRWLQSKFLFDKFVHPERFLWKIPKKVSCTPNLGEMSFLQHPGMFSVRPDVGHHLLTKGYDLLFPLPFPGSRILLVPASTYSLFLGWTSLHLDQVMPSKCKGPHFLCFCADIWHVSSLNVLEVWGFQLCEINHISHGFSNVKSKRNLLIPGTEAIFQKS